MKGKVTEYAVLIEPLSEADGGGWVAVVPELPGCMSDGDTMEQALANALEAVESWKEAAKENGRPIPVPNSSLGQWRQRVPRTLHITLKLMAKTEGVSLNALVAAILAESVGKRFGTHVGC